MDAIGRIGIKQVLPSDQAASGQPGSTGKFSEALDKTRDSPAAQQALPPEVQEVPAAAQDQIKSDLRKKLQTAKTPDDVFGDQMGTARKQLDQVADRVQAAPKTPETQGLRDRLTSVEGQYNHSEQLLSQLDSLNSPRDLLKVQMEMYKMQQNLEILSRATEEMTSGAKQILQTQV
jgi:hypothetical protein